MAKRPVPKYDFKAFGAAIKAARTGRKESRKKVSDEMFISPRYLANIENKGQHPSLQIFFELMLRYNISVDQFLLETPPEKNTQRRQLDALLDGITVPSSVPKRGIQQYVMAEAERIEKKFKYGVEESDQTHFEQYAENWLKRQEPFFKATTYAGYKRNLDIVYPLIGGIPLAKLLPMTLEEMCEELRKRPGRGGKCIKETTVQKYLETVSSVLEDAKKNDIIPFNPAHRVRKKHIEKEVQHIPQKYEMSKLMWAIQNEPILYRAYYTLAITTGLRRGELCALQWRDITGACELTVRRSRSCASGEIVESDTKSHRERIVTIPLGIWELLMALRQQQVLYSGVPDRKQPIFTDPDGHVPHPDIFTRRLRKLYKQCGLSEEYHLHTLRHFYATYLLQEGTSKQVAASLLGHADTAFLERTYCHPQDMAKQQAAKLMQDLLNNQNPCYVAFMKNKNRKAKKAG